MTDTPLSKFRSAFLSPSAPPNGSSTNEATAILQAASPSNKTLEEILTQGGSTTSQAHAHQVLTETTAVGLEQVLAIGGDVQKGGEDINVEGEPPAKRLKLNSAGSSEGTHKDGSECHCVCVCVCVEGVRVFCVCMRAHVCMCV